jgi:hypothetical protein
MNHKRNTPILVLLALVIAGAASGCAAPDAGVSTLGACDPTFTGDAGTVSLGGDAGTVATAPAPAPAPTAPATAGTLYPLGDAPAALGIRWPAAPVIARTVDATTLAAANTAASTPGTRVRISGALAGTIAVRANDVELQFAAGASTGVIRIARGLSRIAIRGGRVEHVEIELPATFWPAEEWRAEWMTNDVLIDGVEANALDTAFLMRAGRRIAILRSRATAARYSVWFGDTATFESEDVILAGNRFVSAGPEATVRLVHVRRSAVVDNRIENNGSKHNYRIHGRSDLNWASRNMLVRSGMMLGTMAGDAIGTQWFDDNVLFHSNPSLLEINLDSPRVLSIQGNTVYSNVWSCIVCRTAPSGWTIADNTMLPYTAPPAP